MTELIYRVRSLIADNPASIFSDQEAQDALDRRRQWIRYALLVPQRTVLPGGEVQYLDYFANLGYWENNVQLIDRTYSNINNLILPDTSDLLAGHWQFSANQYPPVWIVGNTFDIYGSAADLLEQWASKLKLDFDFGVQQTKYSRSQQIKQILEMALTYRAQSIPRGCTMNREDTNSDYPAPGPVWGEI